MIPPLPKPTVANMTNGRDLTCPWCRGDAEPIELTLYDLTAAWLLADLGELPAGDGRARDGGLVGHCAACRRPVQIVLEGGGSDEARRVVLWPVRTAADLRLIEGGGA